MLESAMNFTTHIYSKLKPENVFLVIYIPLSLIIAILYPVGAGFDEGAHVARVAQISSGQILSQPINPDDVQFWYYSYNTGTNDLLYGGNIDRALLKVTNQGNDNYLFNFGLNCTFPTWETPELYLDIAYGEANDLQAFSNTAINSPVSYLPQILGFILVSPFMNNPYFLIIIMRLFQALFLLLILYFCIKIIPLGKWPLTIISILPTTIFLNSGVGADTVCVAVCIVFLVALLKLMLERDTNQRNAWIILSISIILMGIIKMTYLPLAFLSVLIPIVRIEYRNIKYIAIILGSLFLSLILFGIWYKFAISGVNTGAMFNDKVHPDEQLQYVLQNPLLFVRALIDQLNHFELTPLMHYGTLGAHNIPIYDFKILLIITLAFSFILIDKREVKTSLRLSSIFFISILFLVSTFAVFILINLALYLQFTPVGSSKILGVQPRYFLPILPFVISAFLLPCRPYIRPITNKKLTYGIPIIFSLSLLNAFIILCNFIHVVF